MVKVSYQKIWMLTDEWQNDFAPEHTIIMNIDVHWGVEQKSSSSYHRKYLISNSSNQIIHLHNNTNTNMVMETMKLIVHEVTLILTLTLTLTHTHTPSKKLDDGDGDD